MSIEIVKLDVNEWANICEPTMAFSFPEEQWPREKTRIDYALIVQSSETKLPYGFLTVVEFDNETAHVQHGGAFPSSVGSAIVGRAFLLMMKEIIPKYTFISMKVWNKNPAMIKLAAKAGFLIVGTETNAYGAIFLIHEISRLKHDH